VQVIDENDNGIDDRDEIVNDENDEEAEERKKAMADANDSRNLDIKWLLLRSSTFSETLS